MPRTNDGPCTPNFAPVPFAGNMELEAIPSWVASQELCDSRRHAPSGDCVCWGIPFSIGRPAVLIDSPVEIAVSITAQWLVFLHASDLRPAGESPSRGPGRLGEHAADYTVRHDDGGEECLPILRRRRLGAFTRRWGENCFEAVAHRKPRPQRPHHEQPESAWGPSQTRVDVADSPPWIWWLWAWEDPRPTERIRGLRLLPSPALGKTAQGPPGARRGLRPQPEQRGAALPARHGPRAGHLRMPSGRVSRGGWEKGANNQLPILDRRTILDQIEGAIAYLDTVGTRAETTAYKRMRLVLQGAHRPLHNRMHAQGHYHEHTPTADHPEHHGERDAFRKREP